MAYTHAQKLKAAEALENGHTQLAAAGIAGVTRSCIAQWNRTEWFRTMRASAKGGPHLLELAPPLPPSAPASLPADWRQASALQLAAAVPKAVDCIAEALDTDDPPTKAQLDTARWVIERMGIVAPEEVPQDEIVTVDDTVAALASEVPLEVLLLAVDAAREAS